MVEGPINGVDSMNTSDQSGQEGWTPQSFIPESLPTWNCTSDINDSPRVGGNVVSPILNSLAGIAGNVAALVVLHWSSSRQQTRTVFYVLVASLAWIDLVGIVLTTWPVIVVYSSGEWPGGQALCSYHAFAMVSVSYVTPSLVFTMALERLLGIRFGFFYKRHVTRRRIRALLLVESSLGVALASLPFLGFGQFVVQYPNTWCYIDIYSDSATHAAYAAFFAAVNLSLIGFTLACNCVVIATLWRMRVTPPANERRSFRKRREAEVQMVVLLVGVTVIFTACWSPLMFQILMKQMVDHRDSCQLDFLTVRLATVNQILDPWVYILLRKVFFLRCWIFLKRRLRSLSGFEALTRRRIARSLPVPVETARRTVDGGPSFRSLEQPGLEPSSPDSATQPSESSHT